MSERLRSITFTSYLVNGEVQNHSTAVSGVFHQWGNDVIKLENSWYSITVGIVETAGGKIFNATPETITFTKGY